MEITESQLNTVLQEAFTLFLAFLSHTQRLREAKLPRQGKGVETTADVSTQQYHQTRVAAIETCLQYTEKIARRVGRWHSDPYESGNDEGTTFETEVPGFNAFIQDNHDNPFIDIFSGAWIHPTTSFSAGPSGGKPADDRKDIQVIDSQETAELVLVLTIM